MGDGETRRFIDEIRQIQQYRSETHEEPNDSNWRRHHALQHGCDRAIRQVDGQQSPARHRRSEVSLGFCQPALAFEVPETVSSGCSPNDSASFEASRGSATLQGGFSVREAAW